MAKEKPDLLQGTLDLLVLKALQLEPMHGFGISVRIRQMSDEVLQVEQGSLYPALYRLEEQGWISAEWGTSENNRKARFYKLTAAGRKQLNAETENWERVSAAINLVLKGA
jgi:PadR family transcriptional regulator PadR